MHYGQKIWVLQNLDRPTEYRKAGEEHQGGIHGCGRGQGGLHGHQVPGQERAGEAPGEGAARGHHHLRLREPHEQGRGGRVPALRSTVPEGRVARVPEGAAHRYRDLQEGHGEPGGAHRGEGRPDTGGSEPLPDGACQGADTHRLRTGGEGGVRPAPEDQGGHGDSTAQREADRAAKRRDLRDKEVKGGKGHHPQAQQVLRGLPDGYGDHEAGRDFPEELLQV